jgi:hypothetical protein
VRQHLEWEVGQGGATEKGCHGVVPSHSQPIYLKILICRRVPTCAQHTTAYAHKDRCQGEKRHTRPRAPTHAHPLDLCAQCTGREEPQLGSRHFSKWWASSSKGEKASKAKRRHALFLPRAACAERSAASVHETMKQQQPGSTSRNMTRLRLKVANPPHLVGSGLLIHARSVLAEPPFHSYPPVAYFRSPHLSLVALFRLLPFSSARGLFPEPSSQSCSLVMPWFHSRQPVAFFRRLVSDAMSGRLCPAHPERSGQSCCRVMPSLYSCLSAICPCPISGPPFVGRSAPLSYHASIPQVAVASPLALRPPPPPVIHSPRRPPFPRHPPPPPSLVASPSRPHPRQRQRLPPRPGSCSSWSFVLTAAPSFGLRFVLGPAAAPAGARRRARPK